MAPRIRIYRSGELVHDTEGAPGETLLSRIRAAGVFLDAPCGGNGKCGKCLVRLSPDGREVRACRTAVGGDIDVYLPEDQGMSIAGAGIAEDSAGAETATDPAGVLTAPGPAGAATAENSAGAAVSARLTAKKTAANSTNAKTAPPRSGLGVAVDIGTTSVVAHLTDIATGKRFATASGINAQRPYGADVVSRIRYCMENGHATLTRLIQEQLASLIRQTCAASGERASDIRYISIAANTVMEHLAAGYSPIGMGAVPFEPVSLFGGELPAWESLPAAKTARVYFAPAISSYIGGDITAGILAAGLEEMEGPAIYLDIGTNGEIVLKTGGIYYCCAAAAGPAFEGAEIAMGMAAVSGAIDHVKWDGGLKLSVIGDGSPRGICGSGLISALAVLFETGAVDETGRLLDANEVGSEIAAHLGKLNGENVFRLAGSGGGVYLSATDIRKLQLAKSAIAAGIQTLLRHAGIAEEQVELLILAGGFGSLMDRSCAARVGLFPERFLPASQTLGNTAGEGAALALCSGAARAALEDIRNRCEYVELSANPVFNEQFIEQMMFTPPVLLQEEQK